MLDAIYHLDRSGWRDVSGNAQEEIVAGERIRKEMTLDLLGWQI